MSWYKKSQDIQQAEFGFMDESTEMESPELFHAPHDLEGLEEICEKLIGSLAIESALMKYHYNFEKIVFPEKRFMFLVTLEDGSQYVIPDSRDPWPAEVTEWIYSLSILDLSELFPSVEFNFWEDNPGRLYHGTYPEKLEGIMAQGLLPKSDSRGIANRHTGTGVFMAEGYDETFNSFPIVIEVNTSLMAEDGYTPVMEREDPIVEHDLRSALAHRLGLDIEFEQEAGIYESTVICRDAIPVKYLKVME